MIDNTRAGRLRFILSTSLVTFAIALAFGGCSGSGSPSGSTAPSVASAPTFSPAAGSYTTAQSITISDATPGATIFYTTDGSAPSTASNKYTAPIALSTSATTTVQAVAAASGYSNSAVASATYTITLPAPVAAATPTFSPAVGTYTSAQSVTISDATPGATIYYTTDGSTPTSSSAVYSSAVALTANGTTTLKAIATASGFTASAVASAAFTLTLPAATPTFSPAAGTFTSAQSVAISDATPGATIYYTTDGSTPTVSSPAYSKAISLSTSGTTTLKAIASASGYSSSAVASATYTLNLGTTTPPAPSYTYKNVQIVGGGFVDGLFFHPKAKGLMYARTDVGGAYRWNNTTGGDTQWVPLLDFIGRFDSGFNLGVESLALDPNDSTRLYLAVGEYADSFGTNGYILTSANMGNTFNAVPLPFKNGSNDNGRFAGERLSVDPNNGKHIYYGTRGNGLYQSTDQGNTWTQVPGFPVTAGTGTPADPGAGIVFEQFLATSGTAGSNTKTVYFGVSDPTTGLYVSNDGGGTFAPVPGQPSGFYVNAGTFDPSNRYLYLSYARQAKVTGYQQSTPCTSGCTSIGPGGVNDGQIWRYTLPTSSTPNGTWTNITPPLLAGETSAQYVNNPYGFSGVTIDPSHPDTVMVTTLNKYYPPPYDDVFRSLDDGATWVDYGSKIVRDGSLSPWINFGQATPDGGNWLNHLVVDPFNSDHMMYGDGQTIWQTTNATAVDGATTSATTTNPGNATDWSIGALGVEETVVLGLASPPSGPANLLSVMGDLGGFTHVSLTKASAAQQN
ncbi:MAG TPA: chitobiase/beta-hexosaminidase C-terminal domain-containing protein, partial [Acidobacteriaceae bacterium]|nr:chitobiase/beta-hexosaminidase C-terminal domain-containing protein [Acidobacteriaceae bacterium]